MLAGGSRSMRSLWVKVKPLPRAPDDVALVAPACGILKIRAALSIARAAFPFVADLVARDTTVTASFPLSASLATTRHTDLCQSSA